MTSLYRIFCQAFVVVSLVLYAWLAITSDDITGRVHGLTIVVLDVMLLTIWCRDWQAKRTADRVNTAAFRTLRTLLQMKLKAQ